MQKQKIGVRVWALTAALAAAWFLAPNAMRADDRAQADPRVAQALEQARLPYTVKGGVYSLLFQGPRQRLIFLDIHSHTERTAQGEQRVIRAIVAGRYINFPDPVQQKVREAGRQLKEGWVEITPSRHPLDNQFIFFAMKVPADADGAQLRQALERAAEAARNLEKIVEEAETFHPQRGEIRK